MSTSRIIRGRDAFLHQPETPETATSTDGPPPGLDRETLRAMFADELAALFDSAREEGREAGEDEARNELEAAREALEAETLSERRRGDAEIAKARARLDALCEAIASERASLRAEAEAAAVLVAHEALTRILAEKVREVSTLESLIRAGLERIDRERPVTLCLAPEDMELLEEQDAFTGVLEDAGIEIVVQTDRAPGTCHLDGTRGHVEAGLLSQVEAFTELLAESYRTRGRDDG